MANRQGAIQNRCQQLYLKRPQVRGRQEQHTLTRPDRPRWPGRHPTLPAHRSAQTPPLSILERETPAKSIARKQTESSLEQEHVQLQTRPRTAVQEATQKRPAAQKRPPAHPQAVPHQPTRPTNPRRQRGQQVTQEMQARTPAVPQTQTHHPKRRGTLLKQPLQLRQAHRRTCHGGPEEEEQ